MASNYAGFGVRLGTALVTTPLFIRALGEERYGSWVLLWSIASYLAVLDLGLGIAIRKFVAQAIATGDIGERDRKFNACLSVYLLISGVVLVLGLPFVAALGRAVALDPTTRPLVWKIGIILVLDVALAFPLNAFQGLITAYQRFELTNVIRVGMEVVRNLLLVLGAASGASLTALAALQFTTTVVTFALIVYAAIRVSGELRLDLFRLDLPVVRAILGYSGWVVLYLGAQSALNLSSSVIVGLYTTAAVVTEFYVAYRLVSYIVVLPSMMTNVLLPLASEREAQGDWEALRRVFVLGSNAQALLLVPAAVGTWQMGVPFFHLWLGPGFQRSAVYLLLLLAPMVFAQGTACSIAFGIGRQRAIACITGASAVVTLGAAATAARVWGPVGVCAAYALVGLAGNVLVFVFTCRMLKVDLSTSFVEIWAGPVTAGIIQCLVTRVVERLMLQQAGALVFFGLCSFSLAVYLVAVVGLHRIAPRGFLSYRKVCDVSRARFARLFLSPSRVS